MGYLIGFDIGSSSIKAALVEAETFTTIAVVQHPDSEMDIISKQPGWAEQHPEVWWENVCLAAKKLIAESLVDPEDIRSIGLSYQMHGLVLVDKDKHVLRPSIIWCDSRAVDIGDQALKDLGKETCYSHLLNSPGNFTASKLKWVKDNEPNIYRQVDKFILPGDYINMKMTGEINSTVSGLSEGVLWDFKKNEIADFLLEYYKIEEKLVPDIVETFTVQGKLSREGAEPLGLKKGTPVTYRAGDQPNNALSLNVNHPGEVAATGGTSGVVYAVVDKPLYDPQSRVNSFAHVNHTTQNPRVGVLLCINGAGIQYSWLNHQMAGEGATYEDMERMAGTVPINSDGLRILPFGNGSERILNNRNPGSQILNLHFNRHGQAHFYRAALEGIAFSYMYGMEILNEMGIETNVLRVGNDNLFRSEIFSNTVASLMNCKIEVIETTGAVGAAKGSAVYKSPNDSMGDVKISKIFQPKDQEGAYKQAYKLWKNDLLKLLVN